MEGGKDEQYRFSCCSMDSANTLQSSLIPSLVPRPKEEEEEKGPGFSHSRMRLIISDLTTC